MIAILALASVLSAALLFAVQPMAAKMALPLLGGGAGVWTTCMLFFQAGLLAGYGWAHLLGSRFALRTQVLLHGALAGAALFTLPPALNAARLPDVDASPAPWLLAALAVAFGLPYATLAATGPLLQRWFAGTNHARAADPYFLYAASNIGSFLGLLAYPFVLERTLPLHAGAAGPSQAHVWSVAFGALCVLIVASGSWAARRPAAISAIVDTPPAAATSWSQPLRWVALAFVPSSAVLGVTQYLTSDIAAIPLFWIVPLAIYLLTFVVAFAPRVRLPGPLLGLVLGVLVVASTAAFHMSVRAFGPVIFPLHLAVLAAVGLSCHARLAADRPDRSRLTSYYLWIALGGCLGGVFNAILAPTLFDTIAEYPIALALALFLVPDATRATPSARGRLAAWSLDVAAALAIGSAVVVVERLWPAAASGVRWPEAVKIGVPSLLTLALLARPRRFAVAVAALLAVTWPIVHAQWSSIHRDRTFYGVHRIMEVTGSGWTAVDANGQSVKVAQKFRVLIDGVTRHGSQSLAPERQGIPTTYYHPSGPLGDIVRGLRARGPIAEVALIGLGAGTASAYGAPGEHFTYFEIDPAVARLARDPALFTYVTDSRAQIEIVLGDGRRRIAERADGSFDLIVLDAFSSDAIPVHLLTKEAVALYLRKLKPRGCLALHLSNGYLALELVVTAIAADLGVPNAVRRDANRTAEQRFEGKEPSLWAVMTRRDGGALPVSEADGWSRTQSEHGEAANEFLWTDDRSNLVGLMRRR